MCAFQMKVVRDPFQTVKSCPKLSALDMCMFHLHCHTYYTVYIIYYIIYIIYIIYIRNHIINTYANLYLCANLAEN